MNHSAPEHTCIDLFCGCGGFSLGMQRAGFQILAAIDSDREAIAVFDQNFPSVPFVLHEDLTVFAPEKLAALLSPMSLGTTSVDVIVGGPPCQGFSVARQSPPKRVLASSAIDKLAPARQQPPGAVARKGRTFPCKMRLAARTSRRRWT